MPHGSQRPLLDADLLTTILVELQALHFLSMEELVCQKRWQQAPPGTALCVQRLRHCDGPAAATVCAVGRGLADCRVLDARASLADRVQVSLTRHSADVPLRLLCTGHETSIMQINTQRAHQTVHLCSAHESRQERS